MINCSSLIESAINEFKSDIAEKIEKNKKKKKVDQFSTSFNFQMYKFICISLEKFKYM